MRVCHVVGPDFDPAQVPALHAILSRMGRDSIEQHLVSYGERPALPDQPGPPSQTFVAAVPSWLRWIRPFPAAAWLRRDQDALLHAWGLPALAMCHRASGVPIVCFLHGVSADNQFRRRLSALATSRVVFAVSSQASRARLIAHGIASDRIAVIRGPIDFGEINQARRTHPRDSHGLARAKPTVLITAPASRGGGQLESIWAAAIVQQVHGGLRIICPFASKGVDRVRRFVRANRIEHLMLNVADDRTWPQLLSIADVLIDGAAEHAATEPLAWAMASGVPIVATAIRSTTELLADRHNALLSRDNTSYMLASTLLRMLDDPHKSRNWAETGRGQAYEFFGVRDYLDNVRRLYENLRTGEPAPRGIRDTAMHAN